MKFRPGLTLLIAACMAAPAFPLRSLTVAAQSDSKQSRDRQGAEAAAQEKDDLDQAISEAGSAVDVIHALEEHLAKYPKTERRPEIERALTKAAMDTRDDKRIVLYGERVIKAEPDDLQLLERVARALLAADPDKAAAERALDYAKRYEAGVRAVEKDGPPTRGAADWRNEVDRGLGRALVLECRAEGNLGRTPEAIALAQKSYVIFPSAEAAREIGRCLEKAGRNEEAIERYADAFSIPDSRATQTDRAADRARMGELYRKAKSTEAGLGDLILAAYDRTTALIHERELRLRQLEPNAGATDPLDFTLTGVAGDKLALGSLKGKVVVMDFWATWCGPCRSQHPLYEKVMAKFKDRPEVVFLSINTDEERGGVAAFLKEHGWDNKRAYYEDGLSSTLRISSIPTTLLIGKDGEISSRMNGFLPERFVDMLTERIEQALAQ